ncbi:hypothetical protein RLDS_03530 [Sphingobium lactosutens DS20]|uniref:Uncharacterized protein n=1 Tax=Sphingobium lactosutens DS20 TaxID=1331060 RepID=T0J7J5_9SPHN|nr:hypothetical protein RLDS_03530 [Sphingobium lactosutens DS20]
MLQPLLPSPHPALDNEQANDLAIATGLDQMVGVEHMFELHPIHESGLCQCAFEQSHTKDRHASGQRLSEEIGQAAFSASLDQRCGQSVGKGCARHGPVAPSLGQSHERLAERMFDDRLRKQRMDHSHHLRAAAGTKCVPVAGYRFDLHALGLRHALERPCPCQRSRLAGMDTEGTAFARDISVPHRRQPGRGRDPPDTGLAPARERLQTFEVELLPVRPAVLCHQRRGMLEEQRIAAAAGEQCIGASRLAHGRQLPIMEKACAADAGAHAHGRPIQQAVVDRRNAERNFVRFQPKPVCHGATETAFVASQAVAEKCEGADPFALCLRQARRDDGGIETARKFHDGLCMHG